MTQLIVNPKSIIFSPAKTEISESVLEKNLKTESIWEYLKTESPENREYLKTESIWKQRVPEKNFSQS